MKSRLPVTRAWSYLAVCKPSDVLDPEQLLSFWERIRVPFAKDFCPILNASSRLL